MPDPTSDTLDRIHDRIAKPAPAGVWSRADFLEPFGAFQNDDAEAAGGERKRGGKSPDARTSNDDGA